MSNKFTYSVFAVFQAVVLLGLIGCSSVFATQPESILASNANADDYMAAAMHYQSKAQELAAEAERYEAQAATLGPYVDPKGFRRSGLKTAAQEKRGEAAHMQELYAAYLEKAQTMYGMKKQE